MSLSASAPDYLLIGHLACDRTPQGLRLGGTAAYAALTAKALGLRVGVVTAWGGEIPLHALQGIALQVKAASHSTTFENVYTEKGRLQYLHHVAPVIDMQEVPLPWREATILHLGPIAQEIQTVPDATFKARLTGMTLQGWLRTWDESGRVSPCDWPQPARFLRRADVAILSREDVNGDESRIQTLANDCQMLVVTAGKEGACLFWNGREYPCDAPQQVEVDATGAGDIFAAAFFCRLLQTDDPREATRFATHLASCSVTRSGLAGIPTPAEIEACLEVP
jgi:sugar/nucleoside kinase (ribokinase family)